MTTRITVHCDTVWAEGSCPTSLTTDAPTLEEARRYAAELRGWRTHPDGRDYCDGCSGTRRPGFVAPVVHLHPERASR